MVEFTKEELATIEFSLMMTQLDVFEDQKKSDEVSKVFDKVNEALTQGENNGQ